MTRRRDSRPEPRVGAPLDRPARGGRAHAVARPAHRGPARRRTSPHEPPEPPTRAQRRLWPLVVLGALLACVLFGAGVLGAKVLLDDDDSAGVDRRAAGRARRASRPTRARARSARSTPAPSPSVVFVAQPRGRRASRAARASSSTPTARSSRTRTSSRARAASQVRFEDNGDGVDAEVLGTDAVVGHRGAARRSVATPAASSR